MLTHDYSYASCLDGSVHNAWTVDNCFQGRDFDFAKPFLPERIVGVSGIKLPERRRETGAEPDPRQ
jgi:hypothetical protein